MYAVVDVMKYLQLLLALGFSTFFMLGQWQFDLVYISIYILSQQGLLSINVRAGLFLLQTSKNIVLKFFRASTIRVVF